MRCDRCGRENDEEPMVTMGSKRPYRNLCRTCWGVETRSSNTRLISALNEMTRRMEGRSHGEETRGGTERGGSPSGRKQGGGRSGDKRAKRGSAADVDDVVDRRHDPDRPQWHS